MGKLDLQYRVLGLLSTNVYFLINKETKEAIVVDPGGNPNYIMDQFKLRGYTMKAIILTHGHFDHFGGAIQIKKELGVPVYCFKDEARVLADTFCNRSEVWSEPITLVPDDTFEDGQVVTLAGLTFKVLHTPGHTEGGCCYFFEDDKVLISGDTLFFETYGRTDLPTGSQSAIVRSICDVLFKLPKDTVVYPGHGDSTTIEHEIDYNPASPL